MICFHEYLLEVANVRGGTEGSNRNVKTKADSQEEKNSGQTLDCCAFGDTHSQTFSFADALEDVAVMNTFDTMLDL